MFIQTETTPNPATLKFLPGRAVMGDGTLEMTGAEEAERSPLARALFTVPGVSGIFFGSDFISVTKSTGEWPHLKPAILGAIMEHYMSGEPLVTDAAPAPESGAEFYDAADEETVEAIKDLLETACGRRWRATAATSPSGGSATAPSIWP